MVSWLKELNTFEKVVLSLIFIGFLLYANSFANEMFWDDDDGILNNQYIRSWEYFPKYFSENLIAGAGLLSNYWRPMILTIFSIEWHLWQDWVLGYHFINTSLHIADAILLFFILFYIFKRKKLSFITALIFLIHPLQTEAVTYISGIGDSLSVFFIFSGILFYLKFRKSGEIYFKNKFYFLSLLMYVFALLSKETAFVMPGFVFLADFFFLQRIRKTSLKERLKEIVKSIWPFFVLAGVYLLLRATTLNFVNTFNLYNEENLFTSNIYFRVLTFFKILTVYFGLLFWPLNLHMKRSVEIATSFGSFPVVLGAVLFFGLMTLAFLNFKKLPVVSFGILWFFVGIALTSNVLVPINGLLYEHWMYLPMIGIFLALIWFCMKVSENRVFLKKCFGLMLIIFLIFLGILTVKRNTDWRSPITFYEQTLKYAPESYRIVNNLCMAYNNAGYYGKAEETCKKAIGLEPSGPVAYHNLANTYRSTGRTELAEEGFLKAIELDPKFIFSYNALTSLYLERGEYGKAREILERVLDYTGSKINVLLSLSQIAFEEEDLDASLDYLERAEEIRPEDKNIKESIENIKNLIRSKE